MEIVSTGDGSKTLFSSKYGEHYHSVNGAVSESNHIFINLGLRNFKNQKLNILEIGYGTGLNAIMTFIENKALKNNITYHAIDILKIEQETAKSLNYGNIFGLVEDEVFNFYNSWNIEVEISKEFKLLKNNMDLKNFNPEILYDLIYFDAFSPESQPEMWNYNNISKIADNMKAGGLFVTYCSKGIVKQGLRSAGLEVKRFPGPIGKRHVIQAVKK